MARRLGTSIVSLLALAAVAACSDSPAAPELSPSTDYALAKGGKKGGNTPTSPAPDTTTTTTPTSPTPTEPVSGTTVTGCTGTAVTLTADEKATLDLHQQIRAQNGLPLYCVHPALVDAARAHSADMIRYNYFGHNSYDGTLWSTRIVSFGYVGATALSENIAWGSSGTYGDPATIMNNWMNSAGHRATILNGTYREIGIGVVTGTFQGYTGSRVYTADFGTR